MNKIMDFKTEDVRDVEITDSVKKNFDQQTLLGYKILVNYNNYLRKSHFKTQYRFRGDRPYSYGNPIGIENTLLGLERMISEVMNVAFYNKPRISYYAYPVTKKLLIEIREYCELLLNIESGIEPEVEIDLVNTAFKKSRLLLFLVACRVLSVEDFQSLIIVIDKFLGTTSESES